MAYSEGMIRGKALAASVCWLALAGSSLAQGPLNYRVRSGLVVSDSEIASKVGAEVLRKGGNAIDAAVATAFALAVTLPAAGNLGGGGFLVIRMPDGSRYALDFRERAPGGATRDMYLGPDGKPVPRRSTVGWLAAGVPGSVAGLGEAHRRFGKLRWRDVVEPARKLASEGFELPSGLARSLRGQMSTFEAFPESYRVFNRNGRPYEWGEKFVQDDLGRTLTRIRDQGASEFYTGKTALLIAEDMAANGGLITLADLKAYLPVWREPVVGTYRGYEVLSMPPPSSGGIALLEMLNILEHYDLKQAGYGSAQHTHYLIEAMKRAFADRAEHLGDPDFHKVPVGGLTAKEYAEKLHRSIARNRATPAADLRPWMPPIRESEHTTHFSVVDEQGMAVSLTTTINDSYGCKAMVQGAGFLLNNEMDDFAAKPGIPNLYGLIQGEANAIAAGKRPLSSMTPTIVLKDGTLAFVAGSPGGPTIINTVLQTIVNVVDHGMSIQDAVSAPRVHHQWLPDEVRWEPRGISPDTKALLESMGHKFAARPGSMGSCHCIQIDPSTGARLAGIDPRLEDAGAAGY
ncbi:MAG: gamma-glutamyltransferase [Chthonomonadaceae bacterium]|uniref:Glutathione hydrolase proenzyme n=1 Tax=Candidatus Nitrosymbiomonas proteolyticus TaxID=2608984 RepID=A0A809RF37_9BACT|nr:gamma-glutamyltransferase [Candidatus Nitrosymbiomonas proteolyticus]